MRFLDPTALPDAFAPSISPAGAEPERPAASPDPQMDLALASRAQGRRWKRQIVLAKREWNRLSDDELVRSHGRRSQLTRLLESRYAVSHGRADLEVRRFLMSHVDA